MTETMQKPALLDMDLQQLTQALGELGQPAYRARQVMDGLLQGKTIEGMSTLPKSLREQLAQRFRLGGAAIVESKESALDDTRKYLFALDDGHLIEGVLMRYHHGNTLCLSTQVGCRMGCAFCASTRGGLVRNLTAGEMLGQVLSINAALGGGRQVTNLVLMGSGEPLDNYDDVLAFLRRATASAENHGLGISARNISLSTCGLPQGMRRLAGEGLPVTLCLSLHAADEAVRARLIPAARAYPLLEVMDALRHYVATTGRRAIIEYALIEGTNDSAADAAKLAALLKGLQAHVNLIPLNDVPETGLKGSSRAGAERFLKWLTDKGVSATVRRTMGADIEGACGQLRRRRLEEGATSDITQGDSSLRSE